VRKKKLKKVVVGIFIFNIMLVYSQSILDHLPNGKEVLFGPRILTSETLMYKMVGGPENILELYISKKENRQKISSIKGIYEWGFLQFSKDKRKVYFLSIAKMERELPLYLFDGNNGTLRYIQNVSQNYRSSFDGNYVVYQDMNEFMWNDKHILKVIDVNKNNNIESFELDISDENLKINGECEIKRKTNGIFDIFIGYENKEFYKYEVNIEKGTCITIWNVKKGVDRNTIPEIIDDIDIQFKDKTIKIQ
jgi:hypothetical protein